MNNYTTILSPNHPSLSAGTLICTTSGIFPIEELEGKKFMIKNMSGKIVEAECFKSYTDKELIQLDFNKGINIKCSEGQEWPVRLRSGKIIRKEAIDLVIGDHIPLHKNGFPMITEGDNSLSEEEGFLLGYLFGDGYINTELIDFSICFGKESEHIIDKCINILKKFELGKNIMFNILTNRAMKYIKTQNKLFIGWYSQQFEWNNKEKIPSIVWKSNDLFIKGFIDGLISSDGAVNINAVTPRVSISNKSLAVIEECAKLLSFFGIPVRTQKRYSSGNKSKGIKIAVYDVEFSASSFVSSGLWITHNIKSSRLAISKSKRQIQTIKSITIASNEPVWSIVVYDKDQSFPCQYVYAS